MSSKKSPFDENKLGDRIARSRKRAKLTQGELSLKLVIAYQTLCKYEKGHRTPDAELLRQMVNILDVNPGWLLTGKGDKYLTNKISFKVTEERENYFKDKECTRMIFQLKRVCERGDPKALKVLREVLNIYDPGEEEEEIKSV